MFSSNARSHVGTLHALRAAALLVLVHLVVVPPRLVRVGVLEAAPVSGVEGQRTHKTSSTVAFLGGGGGILRAGKACSSSAMDASGIESGKSTLSAM